MHVCAYARMSGKLVNDDDALWREVREKSLESGIGGLAVGFVSSAVTVYACTCMPPLLRWMYIFRFGVRSGGEHVQVQAAPNTDSGRCMVLVQGIGPK